MITPTTTRVKGTMMTDPARVARIVRELVADNSQQESFWVFTLNARNICTTAKMVGLGTLDCCSVHPRDVFKLAVMENAARIIIAHNHPSNDSSPSDADYSITRALVEAGKIMGIEVMDHVVVGSDMDEPLRFCSFREHGWM